MKIRTRLMISFVVAIILLWVAVPNLPIYGSKIDFGFSVLWLTFCLLVIAANFHALLRIGRGENVERPILTKEQRQAMRHLRRSKRVKMMGK